MDDADLLPRAPHAGRPYETAIPFTDPDDVVGEASLSPAQKRALLASWMSDARAVESRPALRRLDSGAYVEIDAIRRAMLALDCALGPANDNDGDPPPSRPGAAHPAWWTRTRVRAAGRRLR